MNTKDLGLIAEQEVALDCLKRGYIVAKVYGDNAPYDLLVDKRDGNVLKIQVKCRSPRDNKLTVEGYTTLYDSTKNQNNRSKRKFYDDKSVDYFAVVHSETLNIYYVPVSLFAEIDVIQLRLSHPKNKQQKRIKMATNYTSF